MPFFRVSLFILCLFSFNILAANSAEARGVIVYNFGGISVEKVSDLPDTDEYKSEQGYLDLGWAQEEYSVYWMPFWKSKGEGYVLYVEDGDTIYYNNADQAMLANLSKVTNETYPSEYPVSIFSKIWGLGVLVLIVFGFIIWGRMSGDDEEAA